MGRLRRGDSGNPATIDCPNPRGSQHVHLDIAVDDADAAEDNLFRVYRDPAGHTFCRVWGITAQQI